jgi:hypothetical protein
MRDGTLPADKGNAMIVSVLALALQAAAPAEPPSPPAGGALRGLVASFDMLCNRVFPDDERIAAAMARIPAMKPLTARQLRIYLKDDPGRGWIAGDGTSNMVVTIESPPFHACAVRMPQTDGAIDEAMWRSVVDAAEARAGGGFTRMPPQSFLIGDLRSAVIGDQRRNPDGSAEAFYLFRTAPADPVKATGYGVELRLVHQIVAAGAH